MSDINFKNHWAEGITWKRESSSGDSEYNIEFTRYGFKCDCIAGQMGRNCKHKKSVEEQFLSTD